MLSMLINIFFLLNEVPQAKVYNSDWGMSRIQAVLYENFYKYTNSGQIFFGIKKKSI